MFVVVKVLSELFISENFQNKLSEISKMGFLELHF